MALNDTQLGQVRQCLEECLALAERYRHVIGDKHSIVLVQDLREIGASLGRDLPLHPATA
jgi:hypothetical protein